MIPRPPGTRIMPPMTQRNVHLRAAVEAVAAATGVARAVGADLERVRKITKDDRSPVTVADFAVQAIVARSLSAALGDVLIVGEEHAAALRRPEHAAVRQAVVEAVRTRDPGAGDDEILDAIDRCDHDATAGAYWTLDPIDGTKGFLRGEQYAIALASIENGRVTVGVLGCPNLSADLARPFSDPDPRGTIFAATSGAGCRQLPADDPGARGSAVRAARGEGRTIRVCASVVAGHSKHDATQAVLAHLGLEVASARIDSQCKYAVVARGQADAYLRMPTRAGYVEKIWDHAAGMLVAVEAGAKVSDITGAALDFTRGRQLEANRGVVAAAAGIHGRLVEAIAELGLAAHV